MDASASPASGSDLQHAETLIGCPLPQVIAHIYSAVANGGFGPGYGLVGIGGGRAGFADHRGRRHCEDQYADFRQEAEISWPAHLIPLCGWGCGIYSCADASTPDTQMSTAFGDALYDDPPHAVVRANCSFAEWLRAWADGHDMWQALHDSLLSA